MPSQPADRSKIVKIDRGARLDSWKEIAAYLGKGERTVKRWETERGMPAYRVPGGGRACVYAYTAELDEWLTSVKAPGWEGSKETSPKIEPAKGPATNELAAASSRSASAALLEAPVQRRGIRGNWILAFSALLLVSLAGMAVYLADLRPADSRMSARLRSPFTQSQPKSNPPVSGSASDVEKTLAHDLYLKGRYAWNQRTPDSLNRALDYFTQAVVHDPGNASAYAGMADTYILLREYSTMPESDAYTRAIAAARKAVELDDSLAEAHRALAFAETNGNWDIVNGEKEFRRAIQLNPTDPLARLWYANSFALPGRFRECLEEINKAQELDPSSHAILADKGLMLFKAGKKEEAIALLKEVERTDPEFRSPHFYLMLIGFSIRDYPNYLMEGDKAAQAVNDPVLKGTLAAARAGYARDGEPGLLRNLYAVQMKYYAAGKIPGMYLARTCILMGKKQEALQYIAEDYARHSAVFLWCLSDPDFLTLKDEPKYKALLKKANFSEVSQDVPAATLAGMDDPPSRALSKAR